QVGMAASGNTFLEFKGAAMHCLGPGGISKDTIDLPDGIAQISLQLRIVAEVVGQLRLGLLHDFSQKLSVAAHREGGFDTVKRVLQQTGYLLAAPSFADGSLAGLLFAHKQPARDCHSDQKREPNSGERGESEFVTANNFLEPV